MGNRENLSTLIPGLSTTFTLSPPRSHNKKCSLADTPRESITEVCQIKHFIYLTQSTQHT